MPGRASYRRSRERAQEVKDWISDVNPNMDWTEYNAKFDALSYFWPIIGDFRRAYDEITDFERYREYHNIPWDELKPGAFSKFAPHVGSSIAFVSKNLMRMYR